MYPHFGLQANLVVTAITRVAGNRKTAFESYSAVREFKPTSAALCKKGREYYINIQVKSEAPLPIQSNKALGVDLGITDIAMTSEGWKEPTPKSQWLGILSAQRVSDL